MACEHTHLSFHVSEHAAEVKYKQLSHIKRLLAIRTDPNVPSPQPLPLFYPAPLILPGDDLALDPRHGTQGISSWMNIHRYHALKERRTIYIVDFPTQHPKTKFMERWSWPKGHRGGGKVPTLLKASDIADYVGAFYHGLPVKILPPDTLEFQLWDENPKTLASLKSGKSKRNVQVGLKVGTELLGIETRPAPDGLFDRQLNLNHLLEAAIDILPKDAFALLLLVQQDMYEGEDDDFCCGRAFGGSRVAAVSTARYNPALDDKIELELEHAWPNSHCLDYIRSMTGLEEQSTASKSQPYDTSTSPLRMASDAVKKFREHKKEDSASSWLGRVCRTGSHEIGHCLGMGHCAFYACAMQGTASIGEDIRQPPYLCPIDAEKMRITTQTSGEEQMQAMLEFCEKHPDVELFVAYAAWLKGALRQHEKDST